MIYNNTLPLSFLTTTLFILVGFFFFLSTSSALLLTSTTATPPRLLQETTIINNNNNVDDFDSINQLFSGNAYIALPDVQLQETGMALNLTNPICKDISIQDIRLITLQSEQPDVNNKLVMILQISGLDINCISDFNFKVLFVPGSGKAFANSSDNVIEARIEFTTPSSFDQQPPTMANITSCTAAIEITNLDFQGNGGGILATSLDAIEKPFRNLLEKQIEKVICDEINTLADPLTNMVIPMMDEFLEPHLISLPESRLDPLFAEESLSSNEGNISSLLNIQELLQPTDNNNQSSIMNNILIQVNDMLSGSTGYINTFLNDTLLNQNGCLIVNMTNNNNDDASMLFSRLFNNTMLFQSHNDLAEMSFTLNGVRICGLTLEPLEEMMIGNHTMRNSLHFSEITMDLYMLLEMQPSTLPDAILQDPDVTVKIREENVILSMSIQDLNITASTLIAVQQEKLLNLPLGAFLLQTSYILPCLVSTLQQLELTGLDVTVGVLNDPIVSGFVDQGVQRILSEFIQAFMYMYRPTMLQAIPNIFQGPVRDLINDKISQALSNVPACPEFSNNPADEPPTFLDFRDLLLQPQKALEYGATGTLPYGDLIQRAVNLAKEHLLAVDPETGLSAINGALIRQLTESQSSIPGRLSFPGSLFDQTGRIQMGGLDASFSFRAYDAYIDNLDSIGAPLSILDPIKDSRSELNNTASLGISKPLQAGLRFFISISGKGKEIRNNMEISLDMDKVTVLLTALLQISESAFFSYPLKDLTNKDCLLMMIPSPPLDAHGTRVQGHDRTAGLVELLVSIAKMHLNITCIDCTGPKMKELEELLATPKASDATTETINDIFGFITKLLSGTFMQVQIDRMLNEARLKCPSSPKYDPFFVSASYKSFETPQQEDSTDFLVLLGISVGVIIVIVLAIILVVKLIVRFRHRKWIKTVSGSKAILLWDRQIKEQEKGAELNRISKSMFTSSAVPLWLRLFMPLFIIGTIGFFVSGHLSLAATVNIAVQLGGQTIHYDSFFEFSMMKSTIEIWNAGGKELAILIMIFSGIWPYTKQIITLVLWFMPPRFVSMSRRLSILLWLDALGKWSMVDIMTLIVTIVGFRVSIQSPGVAFLPENIYSIDLLVAPLWGVYANMIAQILSQISSHFIIHYHRRIQEQASQEYDRQHSLTVIEDEEIDQKVIVAPALLSDSTKERLYNHSFSRPHRGESDKLTTRRGVNTMLVVTGFAMSILVLVGYIIPSFSLEILGIVGILIESGQGFEQARIEHSVFSVISMLMQQAAFTGKTTDYIGLGSLSALLIITVLLVPLALAIVLLYQWTQPLSTRRRYRCEVLVEGLQAWQYADVYIVSVIVASWQLGPVSEYMINSYCGSLDETFAQLVFYGIMKEEDAQCFKINSGIESGSFVLAAGAVVLALLSTFVTRAVGQYFRDKENEARNGEDLVKLESLLGAPEEDVKKAKNGIKPVPVLFTDTFRWFLIRQDNSGVTLRSSTTYDESELPNPDANNQEEDVSGPYSSYEYSPDDDYLKNVSIDK